VAVSQPSVGQYCLTPDPSINSIYSAALVLSLGSPGATSEGTVSWDGYCSTSNPVEFAVTTLDTSGNFSDSVNFTAVIP
jgi:hypothetical protein